MESTLYGSMKLPYSISRTQNTVFLLSGKSLKDKYVSLRISDLNAVIDMNYRVLSSRFT
jgi:hypothetical protein